MPHGNSPHRKMLFPGAALEHCFFQSVVSESRVSAQTLAVRSKSCDHCSFSRVAPSLRALVVVGSFYVCVGKWETQDIFFFACLGKEGEFLHMPTTIAWSCNFAHKTDSV